MEKLKNYMNDQFVIKDEIYKELKDSIFCGICFEILINPVKCTQCKVAYCKDCIEIWARGTKSCPYRHEGEYRKAINEEKLLLKLKFECKNCKDIIKYEDMAKHIYSDCNTKDLNTSFYDIQKKKSTEIFKKMTDVKAWKKVQLKLQSKTKNCLYFYVYFYSFIIRLQWCRKNFVNKDVRIKNHEL